MSGAEHCIVGHPVWEAMSSRNRALREDSICQSPGKAALCPVCDPCHLRCFPSQHPRACQGPLSWLGKPSRESEIILAYSLSGNSVGTVVYQVHVHLMEVGWKPESFAFAANQLQRCRKREESLLDCRLPEFTKGRGRSQIRTIVLGAGLRGLSPERDVGQREKQTLLFIFYKSKRKSALLTNPFPSLPASRAIYDGD